MITFYPKRSRDFSVFLLSVTCESPGEKGFESCRLLYCVKQQLCVYLLNTGENFFQTFLMLQKPNPPLQTVQREVGGYFY
jgi:hypothetical protein